MRDVAMAPDEDKKTFEKSDIWPTVDRVNRALVAIRVSDVAPVVEAANSLDAAMVRLSKLAQAKEHTREEWTEVRFGEINALDEALVQAARTQAEALLEAGRRGAQA